MLLVRLNEAPAHRVATPVGIFMAGEFMVRLVVLGPVITGLDETTRIKYPVPVVWVCEMVTEIFPLAVPVPIIVGEEKLPKGSDNWTAKVLPEPKAHPFTKLLVTLKVVPWQKAAATVGELMPNPLMVNAADCGLVIAGLVETIWTR